MVHVSDKKLQKDVLKRLRARFADGLASIKTRQTASIFLNELLGEEEQLMLSKRLAAIYMLSEKISSYRVSKTLGLSVSTVLIMRNKLDADTYSYIVNQYKKKSIHNDYWKDIDMLLRLGMPRYSGKGRWKWLFELEAKYDSK